MANATVIAFLDDSVPGCTLWFCRGPGKCTQPEGARKKRCEDCIHPREDETLEEVVQKIARGDA